VTPLETFPDGQDESGCEGLEGLVNAAGYIGIAENHLNERRRFSKAISAITEPALRSKSE